MWTPIETDLLPFIPRRWRLILSIILIGMALVLAGYSVLALSDLIGLCSPDFRPRQGISLKPFLNPAFPDHLPWVEYRSSNPYYLYLLGAMLLFGAGVFLSNDMPSHRKSPIPWKAEIILALLVFLVAVFFRFYLSDRFPYGLHYDESTNAMIGNDFLDEWKPGAQARIHDIQDQISSKDDEIQALMNGGMTDDDPEVIRLKTERQQIRRQLEDVQVPVFTPQGFGKATMHMYQIALAMKWFGSSIFSIRLPTMIAGVLGVIALYLLLRLLCDVPAALLGAMFLAAMRWHVNFSRVAYDAIEAPFIITITAFFFFLAYQHRDLTRTPDPEEGEVPLTCRWIGFYWLKWVVITAPVWLLSGYCFGLSIYSYKPLYLFPGFLGVFLIIRFIIQRQMLRWNLIGFCLFGIAAYFCAREMLEFRREHPEVFSERLNMVSILNFSEPWKNNWGRIWDNLLVSYRMFHIRGDINPRHNFPYAPMTHPILGALFPLGMAWALVRWRTRLGLFSLGWFSAMLLPMVLSIEAPNVLRSICIIPVICLWSAIALRQFGLCFLVLAEDWLPGRKWLSGTLAGIGWAFTLFLAVVFWRGEYQLFFRDQLPKPEPYLHYDAKFVDMARFVNDQKGNFYAVSDANGHNSLKLLNKPGIWKNHLFLQQELPAQGDEDIDALYIIMEPWNRPDKRRWLEWLYGPEVQGKDEKDPFGAKIFSWFRIPADIKMKHRGFSLEVADASGEQEAKILPTIPSLSFDPGDMGLSSSLVLKGKAMWVIPEGRQGIQRFRLETPDRFTLWIDGEVVLDATGTSEAIEVEKDLLAGAHQVEFTLVRSGATGRTQVLYHSPGNPSFEDFGGEQFHDRGMLPDGLRMSWWFGSRRWQTRPDYVWVDPVINYRWNPPYKFPFSFRWEGYLNCPISGNYVIGTEAWDYALVEIDGNKVVESPNQRDQKNRYITGTMELSQGRHKIRVLYSDDIGGGEALRLYWTVPGRGREIIPEEALSY